MEVILLIHSSLVGTPWGGTVLLLGSSAVVLTWILQDKPQFSTRTIVKEREDGGEENSCHSGAGPCVCVL